MSTESCAERVFDSIESPTQIRWGARIEVDLPVSIVAGGSPPAAGRMRNISISGALIATDAQLSRHAILTVVVAESVTGHTQRMELAARVIRNDDGAIAIEWCDMACQPLVDLLQAACAVAQPPAREIGTA
jgi:hypothetical protein